MSDYDSPKAGGGCEGTDGVREPRALCGGLSAG